MQPPHPALDWALFGSLGKEPGGSYAGTLTRFLVVNSGTSFDGIGKQTVQVRLRLTDDLQRLEGTAEYGKVDCSPRTKAALDFYTEWMTPQDVNRSFVMSRKPGSQ